MGAGLYRPDPGVQPGVSVVQARRLRNPSHRLYVIPCCSRWPRARALFLGAKTILISREGACHRNANSGARASTSRLEISLARRSSDFSASVQARQDRRHRRFPPGARTTFGDEPAACRSNGRTCAASTRLSRGAAGRLTKRMPWHRFLTATDATDEVEAATHTAASNSPTDFGRRGRVQHKQTSASYSPLARRSMTHPGEQHQQWTTRCTGGIISAPWTSP